MTPPLPPMLQLYAIPVSLYCAKVRIVLRAKGVRWQEVPPPGGYGSAEYKQVVPSGNLPALRDGDLLICDSEAIAEYLNETWSEPAMLSADPRQRARERDLGRFHDTRLEPAVRGLFPYIRGRADPPEGFLEIQSAAIQARLNQMGRLLSLHALPTRHLSLGDCGFPITFVWFEEVARRLGLEASLPDQVATYRARVEAHPVVAAELADYRPKVVRFLDGA